MKNLFFLSIIILSCAFSFAQKGDFAKHNLNVKINPYTSEISVIDSISVEGEFEREFLLNSIFTPVSHTEKIKFKKTSNDSDVSDVGMDREENASETTLKLTKWKIIGKKNSFVISYHGKLDYSLEQSKENYQRGFAQSPGIINELGTYLGGSTFWVPVIKDRLMIYSLTTELPKEWRNVSQGERTKDEIVGDKHIDTWVCDRPQEEIFLIGAKFTEYSHDMNSGIKAMAFLRTPDEGIANKYLEVTEQYMDMYQEMIGDYPYTKFALVENFWETGYGMPSFTLLGEKIIRFPFILHSSYPHELLHNWWGNSVYVDFETGNWCEGTTVFMSDHLIKEQRGAGEKYRRSTLQKYSNTVTPENDFPLNKFISRSDGPTEAIGYGKAMMMWQMLRLKIGDEKFLKGMHIFYKNNKYKTASYKNLQEAMEEASELDLSHFFDQWVNRTGAPEIAISNITTDMFGGKYRIKLNMEQKQDSEVFDIDIPINIATEDGVEVFVFNMTRKEQQFQIFLEKKPLKLVVDAQYDVFRVLHPSEVSPTLTKIWESKENVFILPAKTDKTESDINKEFAQLWKDTDNDNFEIIYDNEIKELPKEKTAWIIGFDNKFTSVINKQLNDYNSSIGVDSINFEKKQIIKNGNSFVFTLSKKGDIAKQNIFISVGNKEAIGGLIRKLPHYGKYSYLAFSGSEPTNIAKGEWPVLNSPLAKLFTEDAEALSVKTVREPLATLKPVFSEARMMSTIEYLASEDLKGRGLGTPEIDQAAEFIAKKFEEAGLKPIGENYYQTFSHIFKEKGEIALKNVIGIIPGSDEKLKNKPVVITAHYDHLGLGWPDVRKGNKGKIHYGADDNASGVAVLIELAQSLGKTFKPKRTVVFLACTAEEAGLIGSRHFVANSKDFFEGEIFANVNLDTEGSLFDKKLLVLNGNTAREWKFIFMGIDYTTGIKCDVIEQDLDASDQVAFIEKGVPGIQLFTGATENYHRPSDVIEKIDGPGLVKVAIVSKEVIIYLADREDPMNFTGTAKAAKTQQAKTHQGATRPSGGASTGSIPDFSFRGQGIKIGSVKSGSTGEKSGLKANDIIIEFDGKIVENLKTYSQILKNYKPGDIVNIKIARDGVEKNISLELGER